MRFVLSQVDTFMFEGHDTTSNGLAWTLHFLGCNKHIQIKAQVGVSENEKEGSLEK